MVDKPLAQSCKYCPSMVCFSVTTCQFPSSEECLRQALFLAQRELAGMKEKANQKHTRMSIKWRDSSFYFKKKAKRLEKFIKANGLKVPTGGEDDGLDSANQENTSIQDGDSGGITK